MTDEPRVAGQLRFASLEGLRALMAWWVVVVHIAILTGINSMAPGYTGPLWRASVAVDVFVMLSGFVIAHLQLSSRRPTYGRYLARRAFRLWPAYLLALLPMIAIPALYSYPFVELGWHSGHSNVVAAHEVVQANLLPHVLLHLSMLHGLVPSEILQHADSSLLSPAWSLSLEWQFYIVAPLLIAFMARSMKWAIGILAGSAAVTAVMLAQPYYSWDFRSFLLSSIVFFAIGMFSRIYLREIIPILSGRRSVAIQIVLVVAALVLIDGMTHFTLGRELAMWLIAMHAVAAETGTEQNRFGSAAMRFLSWRPLRHLGEISYSTYILHIPVIGAWFWLIGRGDTGLSQSAAIAIGVTSVIPIYFVSLASHRLLERPFIRFGARLTAQSSPDRAPGGGSTAVGAS